MEKANYEKLKTRLAGAIHNAIRKDPTINYSTLETAFFDVANRFIQKNKLDSKL